MRCDAMRARGISSISRDRFGMNLDRTMTSAGRSPSYRWRCSFAMRSRSSIITAHAKMQFKLQVHVISRSRETISACRPAGGHSVSNDPIKRIRNASAPPRLGNARSTHRYIHPDFCHYANKHGNSRVAAKRRTRHHASAMRSRKKEKLAKFALIPRLDHPRDCFPFVERQPVSDSLCLSSHWKVLETKIPYIRLRWICVFVTRVRNASVQLFLLSRPDWTRVTIMRA